MAVEARASGPRHGTSGARSAAQAALPAAWAVGTGIVLVSLVLRPGATSTGPVLEEIRAGIGMGTTSAALLSALPGLSFAASGAVVGIAAFSAVVFAAPLDSARLFAVGVALIGLGGLLFAGVQRPGRQSTRPRRRR